ncbi:MAG: TetR family transcriptional regulator, partial [Acidimicrobiia bacterium]|nr:TetR family transcriptional regulator [Acidimicrobiia bacterium]
MNGQHLARAALEQAIPAPNVDDVLLDAAGAVIAEHGLGGLTLARLADVAGVSRMTLHRRNITIAHVVTALSVRAAGELRDAVFPALVGTDPADRRLRLALEAMCGGADRHLPLLAGLF